jgi:hypothetical protein
LDIKQTIHDALLKELVKQDDKGKYPNLIELVRRGKFTVKCSVDLRNENGCIDVVLTYPKPIYWVKENTVLITRQTPPKPTAFELVTDIDFDVGKKLEQLNRYKREYEDTRVIIPEEYKEDYAQLFSINDIVVHVWKGTRRWKCKKCGHVTEVKESSMQPNRCSFESDKKTDLYFIGLKDAQFK